MPYKRKWQCPECGFCQVWSYQDIVDRGNPVCPHHGVGMKLTPPPEMIDTDGLAERLHDELIDAAVFKQEPKYHCLLVRVRFIGRPADGESFAAEATRRLNTAMRTGYCEITHVFQTNIPQGPGYTDTVDVHFILRRQ